MMKFIFLALATLLVSNGGNATQLKLSQLPALSQANWDTLDLIPITDTSAGLSKKTTIGDFDTRYFLQHQNLQLDNATSLQFNGSDAAWRMGFNIGSFTTSHISGTSLQIQANSGANQGFAIGSVGGAAVLEIDHSAKTWLAGDLQIAGNLTATNFVPVVFNAPTFQSLSGSGTYARSSYFKVTAANATAGATYTNNGSTFTVTNTIAGGTTLLCTSTGVPLASGTLTKTSGTGDATISFSANSAPIYIRTRMTGGGGAGGSAVGAGAGFGSAGGGGGGGAYCEKIFSGSALLSSYSFSIPSAAAGAVSSNGQNGGQTTFGTLTANGGNGGVLMAASSASSIGLSSTGGTAGATCDINLSGGSGTGGINFVSVVIGGLGGASVLGTSVSNTSSSTSAGPGNAGSSCGGGGSGAQAASGTGGPQAGGAGGIGCIFVYEFYQ